MNFEVAEFGGYRQSRTATSGLTAAPRRVPRVTRSFSAAGSRTSIPTSIPDFGPVDAFTNIPVVGQVVTQAGHWCHGKIIAVPSPARCPTSRSPQVTGGVRRHEPTDHEPVAGNRSAQASATTVSIDARDSGDLPTAAAADVYRALILEVPGARPRFLGVVAMAFAGVDHLYAFPWEYRGQCGAAL